MEVVSHSKVTPHTTTAIPDAGTDTLMPLVKLLRAVTVAELTTPVQRSLVVISSDSTLAQAVETLRLSKISAAPVVEVIAAGEQRFLGLFDYLDLASFIGKVDEVATLDEGDLEIDAVVDDRSRPLRSLVDYSHSDPFVPFDENSVLESLVHVMSQGVHRVLVNNATDGSFVDVISQSAVIRWLQQQLEHVAPGAPLDSTLVELGLLKNAIKIEQSSTVLQAVRLLKTQGVSALAVVDEHGGLVGNFSPSDLRFLAKGHYCRLTEPLVKFLDLKNSWPITVEPVETLRAAMARMTAEHIHHLWILGEGQNLVGIVSMTDIFRVLAESLPQ